jgi:group I intron endonuclease
MNKIIGIYKITNLINKSVYIGQSIDIERRFIHYKRKACKTQPRLHNSFNFYGIENHKFEIITECDVKDLNNLERYYQDLYDACGEFGLNCVLTESNGRSGAISDKTREKLSKSLTGRIVSEESKKNMSNAQKELAKREDYKNPMQGKSHSLETKIKISKKASGRKPSEETLKKMSNVQKERAKMEGYVNSMKGKKHKKQSIEKISKATKGHNNPRARKVIDIETLKIYECAKYCYNENISIIKINYKSFTDKLTGRNKNNTKFQYI